MFKIVKKGYDPEQVEDFVAKLKKDYEEHLALQKKRIFELKNAVWLNRTLLVFGWTWIVKNFVIKCPPEFRIAQLKAIARFYQNFRAQIKLNL